MTLLDLGVALKIQRVFGLGMEFRLFKIGVQNFDGCKSRTSRDVRREEQAFYIFYMLYVYLGNYILRWPVEIKISGNVTTKGYK